MNFKNNPLVAILLCTYNGESFLSEQLDSLEAQSYQNWLVIVSDDGSTDNTHNILLRYQTKWTIGKMLIRTGPQKGFCQNFLSLACDPEIKADYYAFCDQDDVWFPDKLSMALGTLHLKNNENAMLYCSRTVYINKSGNVIGSSPKFVHPKTFRNALVQCLAGGNTMVFNFKSKLLLETASSAVVPSHDWWLYQLVTGNGGLVYFDQTPRVQYRQHRQSLVGENSSIISRLYRASLILNGKYREMISENINAMESNLQILTPENLEIFCLFKNMRNQKFMDRVRLTTVCGIYRQSWQGTVSLIIANLLKKL